MHTTFLKNISIFLLFFVAVPVSAQSVDLLWQTNTYTPPFYKGKALYTTQSTVTLIALPNIVKNGKQVASKDLIYTWKQDYKVLGSLSGPGKNTYTFKGAALDKPTILEVGVSTSDGSVSALKIISLTARKPEVIVYEDDPLYGTLYNKALGSKYDLVHDEVKLIAVPFFFSTDKTGTENMAYTWNINTGGGAGSTDKNIILRHEGDSEGSSSISLYLSNTQDFFQKTSADFQVTFGAKADIKQLTF